jgi:hypothetical protein
MLLSDRFDFLAGRHIDVRDDIASLEDRALEVTSSDFFTLTRREPPRE